jgi:hypothetical protein
MFMTIHGLATFTKQDIDDEELEQMERKTSSAIRTSGLGINQDKKTTKKRDISLKQFDYIYKNKIEANLEDKGQFKFTEMNLLLNAYEYWRYENINKATFQHLD